MLTIEFKRKVFVRVLNKATTVRKISREICFYALCCPSKYSKEKKAVVAFNNNAYFLVPYGIVKYGNFNDGL